MTNKRIHKIYGWVLTLGLLAAAALLIAGCVSIYRLGNRPFSPETVAAAFSRICVPIYITLGLAACGFLLQLCLPVPEKKSVTPQYMMQLAKLRQRLALNQVDDPLVKARILKLRKTARLHTGITYGLLAVCSGIFLCYGLNPANFHQSEINRSMAMAMLLFFPCLAVPFGYGCFTAFYSLKLAKQEIALTRQVLKEYAVQPTHKRESWLLWLRLGFLCIGLGLLIYGFLTGGTADVLTKAINICTECVGLG